MHCVSFPFDLVFRYIPASVVLQNFSAKRKCGVTVVDASVAPPAFEEGSSILGRQTRDLLKGLGRVVLRLSLELTVGL